MKTTSIFTIAIFIILVAFSSNLFSQKGNPVTPVADTKEEPIDLTGVNSRKYFVQVYLVQRGPLFSPALFQYSDTISSDRYPKSIEEIEKLLVLPDWVLRRKYVICKDCNFVIFSVKN
jgi:hypothetical protein